MSTRTFSLAGSMAGLSFSGTIQRTLEGEESASRTLAAGNAGTLSTRTDDNTGTITATSASHDVTTGSTVTVFWGGATPGVRRGMTVGTVSGTSIPIDLGAGDVLPAQGTAVVVDVEEEIDFDFESSTLVLLVVSQTRRASVEFKQEAGTSIKTLDLGRYGVAAEPFIWASDTDVASPIGADVGKVTVANGSSAGTNLVQIGAGREAP